MKNIFSLIFIIFISGQTFCQDNYTWRRGFKKVIDTDTLFYKLQDEYFYLNVPNLIKLDSKAKKIQNISIQNGRFKKLNDNIYEVYPNQIGDIVIEVTASNVFKLKHTVTTLPNPDIYLKSKSFPELRNVFYKEGLSNYKINADWQEYNYKVLEFTLFATIQGFIKTITTNSDKFSTQQLDLINQAFQKHGTKAKFYIEDIKTIGPDSVIRFNRDGIVCNMYDNFMDALFNSQDFGMPLQNNLRVKITGKPKAEDVRNIEKLVYQLDSLSSTISVKIVNHFPNLVFNFDSISPYSDAYSHKSNGLIFFPTHKKTINNNLLFEYEHERNGIIAYYLARELLKVNVPFNEKSIYNSNSSGLSDYDKSILQLAFSKEGYNKLTEKYFDEKENEFPGKLLLTILISLFLMIISIEVNRSFKILSIIRSTFIKDILSLVFISQLVFVVSLILYGTDVLTIEKSLILFTIHVSVLFYYMDRLISKMNASWLILATEFFSTIIVLTISYHIVYFFTMGELQTLKINNENILLILSTIILVKILIRYQYIKMNQAVKEKDLKISRQNELLVKSQLSAIQAKINPHFLYNSLNSLAELSRKDADKTESMALSLSKLFQYNINKEDEMTIALKEEIKMIELYLSIEKQRFTDKLEYNITVDQNLQDFAVPKFLLQPLVENAMKHGISKITKKGTIKVDVSLYENKISIKIFDNGPDFPDGIINGYGLQNTYEKLDLIYQKPYEVRFVNGDNKHIWLLLEK